MRSLPHPKPPDDTHFRVGVERAHEDLGDRTSTHSSASSPAFVRGIMHKAVNARGFVAHVQYDASAAAIAAAMGVPEQDVENLWLAGVRTPCKSSLDRRALLDSKDCRMGFTPQSVLDCPIISSESYAADSSDADNACRKTGLDRGQFADFFQEDKEIDQHCLEFGNALIGKLEALAGTCRAFPRYQLPARRRSMRSKTLPPSSKEIRSSRIQYPDRREVNSGGSCGFDNKGSHVAIDIRCDGFAICKTGNGLYRTARAVSGIRPPKFADEKVNFYFEIVIVDDKDTGGICIGVATESLPLNKLVGSDSASCGLHSSGQLVTNNGEFRQFGKNFKKGDRVGCLVTLNSGMRIEDPKTSLHSENESYSGLCDGIAALAQNREEEIETTFFVNGEKQGTIREALWRDVPEAKRKLFPVVSLYKKDSKAVMQCCAKDWNLKRDGQHETIKAICGHGL